MSSIYRKGRDGYFYYQTYLFNHSTGKKDKKIFHSLSTKDETLAKSKQIEYDKIYSKKTNTLKSFFIQGINQSFTSKRILLLITFTSFITFYYLYNSKQRNFKNLETEVENIKITKVSDSLSIAENKNLNIIKKNQNESFENKRKNELNHEENQLNKNLKQVEESIQLPKFKVERIEKISGNFNQGKLYVTIDKEISNSENIRLVCQAILEQNKEYSNIVICVYSNDKIGYELANGIKSNSNIEDQKQSWLALFTYNSVEGAFFDDNPTGYLGAY